jgi:nucleotide-binding universal stress UspA family protein
MMPAHPAVGFVPEFYDLEDAGRAILDTALADPSLAGVRVRGHLTSGFAARTLLERADGAGLLVAGTRGFGRLTGALLGSVSRQLLHHAPCPVVLL